MNFNLGGLEKKMKKCDQIFNDQNVYKVKQTWPLVSLHFLKKSWINSDRPLPEGVFSGKDQVTLEEPTLVQRVGGTDDQDLERRGK